MYGLFGKRVGAGAGACSGELNPDEKLLWCGTPNPTRRAVSSLPIVLFGIPWTLFALFWMFMAGAMTWFGAATSRHNPAGGVFLLFPLFGLPFVLVGLGMLTSPFWAARKAKSTIYGVTNRRAFAIEPSGWNGQTVTSWTKRDIKQLERREGSDGSGDLVFARKKTGKTTNEIGFFAVADVRRAEAAVRDALLSGEDR